MAAIAFLTTVLARGGSAKKQAPKPGGSPTVAERERLRQTEPGESYSSLPARPGREIPPAPKRGDSAEEAERKARAIARRIAETLKTGSARAMEDLAAELDRRGQTTAAAEMRDAARAVMRSRAEETAAEAAATAAALAREVARRATREATRATEPEPERRPLAKAPEDPTRQLALRLTDYLWPGPLSGPVRRNKEDRSLVKRFQRRAGLADDGMYGVKSGLAVAELGIVPARPFYFSRNKTRNRKLKRAWTEAMNRYADRDEPRAREWRSAGEVSRL